MIFDLGFTVMGLYYEVFRRWWSRVQGFGKRDTVGVSGGLAWDVCWLFAGEANL